MLVHPISNKFTISRVQNNDTRTKELLPQKTVNNMTLPSFADAKSFVNTSFKANIHYYAQEGYSEDLQREIDNGANINTPFYGDTPLMYAMKANKKSNFDVLIKHPDIDVNAQTHGDITALMIAGRKGYSYMAKKLIEHPKIDVNIQDRAGNTALIFASYCSNSNTVREILKHPNVDVNLKNYHGMTASDYANREIAEMIKDYVPGVDRREGVKKSVQPKQIDIEKLTSFKEIWTDKEKQNITKMVEDKDYNALATVFEAKGTEFNEKYGQLVNDIDLIKKEAEKFARETETKKIREEEKDAANKKLKVKYSELDKTKAEYNEKNAELDKLINNYDTMLLEARKQIREEEKIAAEEKVADKIAELDKSKAEYEEKNAALDHLINDYQTMLEDDVEDAKSGFRALYGVKPETFPEKMGFGEQLVCVVEILNKNKNKLTYFRDDSPEKITKTLQDNNGQISDEGLKFMDRMLQVSDRSCSESDIISSINAVKDEDGLIDMNKASYFIAKYAWGGSVPDIIRVVDQYDSKNN